MPDPGDGGLGYSWFVLELTSEHVEPVEETVPPGGTSGERVYGGGPWMHPWRQSFEGSVELHKDIEVVVADGEIGLPTRTFAQKIPGGVQMERELRISFFAERGPAEIWNRLLAEDEELLLSL